MPKPPSPALLSILAFLATASGSPTPPHFLCPSQDSQSYNKRQFSYPPTPTPTPSPIPIKFVQGNDGLWRRTELYTLYGSTFCVGSCPSPTQTAADPSQSPTPTDDIRDSLPPGWDPVPTGSGNHTIVIVVVSLVMASFICVLIYGCTRYKRLRRRRRDIETATPSTADAAEKEDKKAEKNIKTKLKTLARATATLKNIRHAIRQRKGNWVATHWSNSSRSQLTVSLPSRFSSRRSSVVSLPDDLSQPIVDESPSPMSLPLDAISTPTISPIATSPPAYHHDSQALPVIYSNISHTTSLVRPSSSFRVNSSTPDSFHVAHVATDDKTVLARLVDSASRPPEETSTDALSACDTLISAPAWHDELEEIPPDLITSNDHPPTCLASSLFPPPPSKEHMATGDLYDYSFSLEGTAALEPEPSAPPFHLESAPPPLDDRQIVPFAPPLLDDIEFLVDAHPSAPQLDVGEENPAGQDHDPMSSASGLPSSDVPSLSASRRDIGPGVRDDITLPGYRP